MSGEKTKEQKKKHSLKARQGHIKHACKFPGSNSQKRRGHWRLKEFGVLCLNQPVRLLKAHIRGCRFLFTTVCLIQRGYRCRNAVQESTPRTRYGPLVQFSRLCCAPMCVRVESCWTLTKPFLERLTPHTMGAGSNFGRTCYAIPHLSSSLPHLGAKFQVPEPREDECLERTMDRGVRFRACGQHKGQRVGNQLQGITGG